MPKRRDKRQERTLNRPARPAQSAGSPTDFPSAPTLFRVNLLDRRTHALLRRIPTALKPILLARDRERIDLVEQAATPAALIDLAPVATGLAETTWHDRMRRLGPEAIPLIVDRLTR